MKFNNIFTEKAYRDHLIWISSRGKRGKRFKIDNVDLVGADFSGAILRDAEFQYCNLTDADFNGADLRRAYLNGSTITNAKFVKADMRRTNLDDTIK